MDTQSKLGKGYQNKQKKFKKIMRSISKLEDNGTPTYASSIAVPNVQEMVMKNPHQVPKRYMRNEDELRRKVDISHLSSEIPVVDLSLLSKGNKDELMKLDLACKEWGFFQVKDEKTKNL